MCADTAAPPSDTPDYRETVFLPETAFPMRAGLPQREPEWLARWERIGVYDRLRSSAAGRAPFVLHDGPPYANGHLHIGHALNKVLKDMVVRSQQMMGRDARYVPGWDCHGLPIEWKIEEQYRAKGLNKDDVDVVDFRRECRSFAAGWIDIQREEFKRLGVTGKWDKPYLTMDYHAEAVIADEFMKFVMNGSLYQGSKPVMWSPVEKTALAEAEVEYHDHTSHQVWVRFRVVGQEPEVGELIPEGKEKEFLEGDQQSFVAISQSMDGRVPLSVVIWTTTPWTIPQNRAVAFNPAIEYGLYEISQAAEDGSAKTERVVVADKLAEGVFASAKLENVRRVSRFNPEGLTLAHPFRGIEGGNGEWDYDVPMLPGDHVTDDAGTGFVHTAPSHGDDDYQLGVKFGLPMTYNVEADGSYRANLPLFGGQHIITPDGKEGPANVSVIKQLAYSGALFAKAKLKHSYPHSWRSKAPVIYRNTPQWFVAIDKALDDGMTTYGETIRKRALNSINRLVGWEPDPLFPAIAAWESGSKFYQFSFAGYRQRMGFRLVNEPIPLVDPEFAEDPDNWPTFKGLRFPVELEGDVAGRQITIGVQADAEFAVFVPQSASGELALINDKWLWPASRGAELAALVGQQLRIHRQPGATADLVFSSGRVEQFVFSCGRGGFVECTRKQLAGQQTHSATITTGQVVGRNRLHSMIEARPDWVLSRQRAWGVPLTCFVKKGALPTDPDFLLRNAEVNARIVAAFEAESADVWFVEGFKERVLEGIVNPSDYVKVDDVLDVWFDSGSTHAFVLRDREDGSADGLADLYLEGTDQHRGWFHSSMLQACGTKGRAPYRGVLTHGFTLDEKGMKMSKSLGNTTAPQEVIGEYGADILRLWVAQSDYTVDLRIGKEILKGVADSYRRLRNTMRYMLGALAGFTEAERVDHAQMPELERWVLHRLAELDTEVREGYAKYDFQGVFQKLFTFCTSDLSAVYFDIRKDSLYCDAPTSLTRRACRTVLDLLFHRLTTWLAPVLVFTMEEVWLERFPGEEFSVHLVDFPETSKAWRDEALAKKWETIRDVRRVVTGALEVQRTAKVIGSSLEAAPQVFVTPEMMALLETVTFEEVCITSCVWLSTKPVPEGAFALADVPQVAVVFEAAKGQKCERCWRVLPDVGMHKHPGTCARCNDALG